MCLFGVKIGRENVVTIASTGKHCTHTNTEHRGCHKGRSSKRGCSCTAASIRSVYVRSVAARMLLKFQGNVGVSRPAPCAASKSQLHREPVPIFILVRCISYYQDGRKPGTQTHTQKHRPWPSRTEELDVRQLSSRG